MAEVEDSKSVVQSSSNVVISLGFIFEDDRESMPQSLNEIIQCVCDDLDDEIKNAEKFVRISRHQLKKFQENLRPLRNCADEDARMGNRNFIHEHRVVDGIAGELVKIAEEDLANNLCALERARKRAERFKRQYNNQKQDTGFDQIHANLRLTRD